MRAARLALLVALAMPPLQVAGAAVTQAGAAAPAARGPVADTASISVYLVTFGVGPLIWERFGHNAIRVVDRTRGTDLVYNWGSFDFRDPDFVTRFLTGHTRYWVDTASFAQTVRAYEYWNRSIALQALNLSAAQRTAVRDFVEWNMREENRYYRYDYFLDNCSTRVRDIIDRAIGGALRAATFTRASGTTFRWHTRRLLSPDVASYTGIEIALGEPADRPITAWEEMFLPAKVQQYVREVRVRDAAGNEVPLVAAEETVFTGSGPTEPTRVPRYFPIYLCIGVALGAIALVLGVRAGKGGRGARIGLASFAAVWGLLAGIIGVLLIVAWTATLHIFWKRNENLFQFEPLALLVAVAVPVLLLRGRGSRLATNLTATVAAIAMLGAVLQLLPGIDQVNADIVALALPIWLGLAAAVRLASRPT